MRMTSIALAVLLCPLCIAAEPQQETVSVRPLTPFTGKVTRNKVRMRSGPDLNSPILRELDQGSLVAVVGETDSFYAVKPPKDIKAFIYRTYVLDNVVDGINVNVRLEPSVEAPIIAQLNKGDSIQGKISSENSKWVEVVLPASTSFYVAKDFVEKVGSPDVLHNAQERRQEAAQIVNAAYLAGQMELQKPLDEIDLNKPITDLEKVISQYKDVPEEVVRAKNYLNILKDSYESKKREAASPRPDQQPTEDLSPNQPAHREQLSSWLPKEAELFEQWLANHPNKTMDDFYADQRLDAIQLRGVVQPYFRPIKNKPGNYLLVNQDDDQPIAFLYSTQVDLQQKAGKVVSIVALQRPNNQFAFPAFFVISAQ